MNSEHHGAASDASHQVDAPRHMEGKTGTIGSRSGTAFTGTEKGQKQTSTWYGLRQLMEHESPAYWTAEKI